MVTLQFVEGQDVIAVRHSMVVPRTNDTVLFSVEGQDDPIEYRIIKTSWDMTFTGPINVTSVVLFIETV